MPVPRLCRGALFHLLVGPDDQHDREGRPSVLAVLRWTTNLNLLVAQVCGPNWDVAIIGFALENMSVTCATLFTRMVVAKRKRMESS
jgi:hypothetical protein